MILLLLLLAASPAFAKHHGGRWTTTTIVTSTTIFVATTTTTLAAPVYPQTVIDYDGAVRVNKSCEDIPSLRNRAVVVGQRGCGRNRDLYAVTVAGVTGLQRPTGMPYPLADGDSNELGVPAGTRFYNWSRYNSPQFIYSTTTNCTTGAKAPNFCQTLGCQVQSGTCTLTAAAMPALISFTDGSATWQSIGYDIGMGGLAGPSARAQLGRPLPEGNSEFNEGDNGTYPLKAGRGDYGGDDEVLFAAGWFGDMRNGDPGTIISATNPGLGIVPGITLAIATSPPLKFASAIGDNPTTSWVCGGPIWESSFDGRTRQSRQLRCMPLTQGGFQVSMPNRDGWSWPSPWPVGRAMLRVYWMLVGGAPCQLVPGQQTCEITLPRRTFQVELDYLYSPTDTITVTSKDVPEYDSPGEVNSTGMAIAPLSVYNTGVGFPAYQPGMMSNTGYPISHGAWTYSTYGKNCTISSTVLTDGTVVPLCRSCDRRWTPEGYALPTLADSDFRTDRYPFGKDGVCLQRGAPHMRGVVMRRVGPYTSMCTLTELADKPDNNGYYVSMEFCDGKFRCYNPDGTVRACQ